MKSKATWTPERTAEAARLWVDENKTGGEIAKILGGVTRHAVINKLRWLGITRSSATAEPRRSKRRADFVMFEDMKSYHCRFPLWGHKERPNFKYCGKRKIEGSPYCREHTELARKPPMLRERKSVFDCIEVG